MAMPGGVVLRMTHGLWLRFKLAHYYIVDGVSQPVMPRLQRISVILFFLLVRERALGRCQ